MAHREVVLDTLTSFAVGSRLSAVKEDYDPRATKWKRMFREWDKNRDGMLSLQDLRSVFSTIGLTNEKELALFVKLADKDGSGLIRVSEFVDWLSPECVKSQRVQHGEALKVLFSVYDSHGTGTITYDEFEECHCLLKSALRLSLKEKEDVGKASLDLDSEACDAFRKVDSDRDRQLTYAEFVRYMCATIDPKCVTQEEFCEVTLKLASALMKLMRGVKKAERGEIKEHESCALELMIDELAKTTRNFCELMQRKSVASEVKKQKWKDPPRRLSIEALKKAHMIAFPLDMRLARSFAFDIVVLPVPSDQKSWPEELANVVGSEMFYAEGQGINECLWIGQVLRKVTFKSGVQRCEPPAFYSFSVEDHVWKQMTDCDSAAFHFQLRAFSPEFGMLCVMKAEANYTKQLSWQGVKNALQTGQLLGWISEEGVSKYYDHMEKWTLQRLQQESGELETPKQAVEDFLNTHLVQRPLVILAMLSHLGIIEVHSAWKEFM